MARLSPAQIAAAAYQAGFRGNALVEITAIALAESGGNARALNPNGEHSVGLTQINMRAHGTRFGSEAQLYDPVTNMRAAFQLSNGGKNFRPWSVHPSSPSPHAGASTRHLATARQAVSQIPGVDLASLQIPLTGMPDTSAARATFGNLPEFNAAQARAQQEAAAHQQRMMQFMELMTRQQQTRGRPLPVRSAVQVNPADFDPAPFSARIQELEGQTHIAPQVMRRQVGQGPVDRESMLTGMAQQRQQMRR